MGKNFQWLTFQTVNHITKRKKKGFVQALRTLFKKKKKKKKEKEKQREEEKNPKLICRKDRQMNPELRTILHVGHSITYGLFLIILFFYNFKLNPFFCWNAVCDIILEVITHTTEFVPN